LKLFSWELICFFFIFSARIFYSLSTYIIVQSKRITEFIKENSWFAKLSYFNSYSLYARFHV